MELSWHQHKNQSEGLFGYSCSLSTLFHRVLNALPQTHQSSNETSASPSTLHPWHHIPDVEVLRRADTISVEALITTSQLRWAGHVLRMDNSRLPKAVLYSELCHGKRCRGGQKLRFKDVLKRHLKRTGIPPNTWEVDASDRPKWKGILKKATLAVEEARTREYQQAHNRRHLPVSSDCFKCEKCDQYCRSRAGLSAHMRRCYLTPRLWQSTSKFDGQPYIYIYIVLAASFRGLVLLSVIIVNLYLLDKDSFFCICYCVLLSVRRIQLRWEESCLSQAQYTTL